MRRNGPCLDGLGAEGAIAICACGVIEIVKGERGDEQEQSQ